MRTAAALAARTHRSLEMTNVRAGRDTTGLRPQHLAALEGIAQASKGGLEGGEVGAESFVLRPGRLEGGFVRVNTGTAASATLIAEAAIALAPGLPTPLTVEIRGGTDVRWSPTLEHFRSVLVPWARRLGIHVEVHEAREGFYPEGGGRLRVLIEPADDPDPIGELTERGRLETIEATVRVSDLPDHIPTRILESLEEELAAAGYEAVTHVHRVESRSPGVVVDAVARFEDTVLGANALGEKGTPSEVVGRRCAGRLVEELESRATVDVHAADQLIPLALGRLEGAYVAQETTGHLETNAWLCERFLDGQVHLEPVEGGTLVRFSMD